MKVTTARIALGALGLAACAAVIWRVGSSAMTTHVLNSSLRRGALLVDQGSISEATSEYEAALSAARDLGRDHARYDEALARVADSYEATGRYDDAYSLRLESLQRAQAAHGSQSAEVATALFDLGRIRAFQGEGDSAVVLLRQALNIWQALHGNEHPDLIPTLYQLGSTLHALGNDEEAGPYLEWGIGLQRRSTGSDSPEVAPLEYRYADVLDKLGQQELASQFRRHADMIVGRPAEDSAAAGTPVADAPVPVSDGASPAATE